LEDIGIGNLNFANPRRQFADSIQHLLAVFQAGSHMLFSIKPTALNYLLSSAYGMDQF
jgi:hypothetical protein